jgi:hypothetical protein
MGRVEEGSPLFEEDEAYIKIKENMTGFKPDQLSFMLKKLFKFILVKAYDLSEVQNQNAMETDRMHNH